MNDLRVAREKNTTYMKRTLAYQNFCLLHHPSFHSGIPYYQLKVNIICFRKITPASLDKHFFIHIYLLTNYILKTQILNKYSPQRHQDIEIYILIARDNSIWVFSWVTCYLKLKKIYHEKTQVLLLFFKSDHRTKLLLVILGSSFPCLGETLESGDLKPNEKCPSNLASQISGGS